MSESKKKTRRKKKKEVRLPKLDKKIHVIKNIEKSAFFHERWTKGRNLACIPHPFRMLALGPPGVGKTNTIKNVLISHAQYRPFKRVYLITCSLENREYNDCDISGVMTEIPDSDFFDDIAHLKTCIILDDYEMASMTRQQKKNLTTLMRFISSHRNVSIVLGYQSFFDCSAICRKCSNVFLLYKPQSRAEISHIANRVGLEADELHHLFNNVCSSPYDSILVDRTVGSPAPLRLNLYQPINITYEDDEEEGPH